MLCGSQEGAGVLCVEQGRFLGAGEQEGECAIWGSLAAGCTFCPMLLFQPCMRENRAIKQKPHRPWCCPLAAGADVCKASSCVLFGADHQFVTLRGFLAAAGLSIGHLASGFLPKSSVAIDVKVGFISILYKDGLSSTN